MFCRILKNDRIVEERLAPQAVALIVKKHVGHAGFVAKDFGGHSLRAGLATSAALAGLSEREIMAQTRHKRESMVRVYIRKGSLFRENVLNRIDL